MQGAILAEFIWVPLSRWDAPFFSWRWEMKRAALSLPSGLKKKKKLPEFSECSRDLGLRPSYAAGRRLTCPTPCEESYRTVLIPWSSFRRTTSGLPNEKIRRRTPKETGCYPKSPPRSNATVHPQGSFPWKLIPPETPAVLAGRAVDVRC